jgi:outer membrane lipoprotein-sorting protein
MIRAAVIFLLLLLLLTACGRPPQPVWTDLPTAAQLLERWQDAQGRYRSLDAEVRVVLTTGGKSLSSQQFLLLERPDRVRVDVVSGFGQPLLQLTSDGEQLAVFLNTSAPGRFFRGPATDENVARFTRLPLATRSLIQLLLYDPPLIEAPLATIRTQEDKLLLSLENADRRQELWFDQQLRLVACHYLAGEEPLLAVQYQQFADDGFPRRMALDLVREVTRVTLQFADLRTNLAIAPAKFVLQQPSRLEVEPLP